MVPMYFIAFAVELYNLVDSPAEKAGFSAFRTRVIVIALVQFLVTCCDSIIMSLLYYKVLLEASQCRTCFNFILIERETLVLIDLNFMSQRSHLFSIVIIFHTTALKSQGGIYCGLDLGRGKCRAFK